MADEERGFALELTLRDGYEFTVDFGDGLESLTVDETPPLGGGEGPNPARMLAAAVGHCMSSSLLYCLRKSRIEVDGLRTRVEGSFARNERGRLRIAELRVTLAPAASPEARDRLPRCLELFEDFCIVGQSVRQGIPVTVAVQPAEPALAV